jgi:periplasmic divalent cation tolerance protein
MDVKHIVVFITVDSPQTAQKIMDVLLAERKAACVNIVPAVESHYWW